MIRLWDLLVVQRLRGLKTNLDQVIIFHRSKLGRTFYIMYLSRWGIIDNLMYQWNTLSKLKMHVVISPTIQLLRFFLFKSQWCFCFPKLSIYICYSVFDWVVLFSLISQALQISSNLTLWPKHMLFICPFLRVHVPITYYRLSDGYWVVIVIFIKHSPRDLWELFRLILMTT